MHDNTVELIGTYGSDETHALSAWTSTSRDLTDEKRGRMDKMLEMLAKNGHHTPFEKSSLHFLVTSDIASHIQMLKHRISVSINGESARYKEIKEDKFYVPKDWPESLQSILGSYARTGFKLYHKTIDELIKAGFSRKRAKESARFFWPYAAQYTIDIMFNFRSFMHFMGLRHDLSEETKEPVGQKEIFDIAEEMLRLVRETGKFDMSLKAFGY